MITVTKKFEFHSAHFLPDYPGQCNNMHGHGFHLEVTVSGFPRKKTYDAASAEYPSMVIDFGILKQIVKEEVIDRLDHKLLNNVHGIEIPTAENLVMWIYKRLKPRFGKHLQCIKLYETDDSYAEWRR